MTYTDITNMNTADLDALLGMNPEISAAEEAVCGCFTFTRKLLPYITRWNGGYPTDSEETAEDVVNTAWHAGWSYADMAADPDGATREAWGIWKNN